MKVILEFEDDERTEARRALEGSKAHYALWEIRERFRRIAKNCEKIDPEKAYSEICEIINDSGINLDEC